MRELWTTGWMHNRVRMIVASLLTKNLRQPWLEGARWFWDTLVDADLASNTLGWQWTAGCGADAAPYFRVFNPALQAARHDPGRKLRASLAPGRHARLPAACRGPAAEPGRGPCRVCANQGGSRASRLNPAPAARRKSSHAEPHEYSPHSPAAGLPVLFVDAPVAQAATGLPAAMPERAQLKKVGGGQLSWLGFDIYDASLWTGSGRYEGFGPGQTVALSLWYQRSFTRGRAAGHHGEGLDPPGSRRCLAGRAGSPACACCGPTSRPART